MAGRSSRRGGGGAGNERIQALVEQKLAGGLQYEALQLYRGVVSRKSARGQDDAATSMAEQGMGVLLRGGYADSATELGNVLVAILTDHELIPNEERVGRIKRVNAMYEDAKQAAVLPKKDRRTAAGEEGAGGREEGGGRNDDEKSTRGMHSVGTLQVGLPFLWLSGPKHRLNYCRQHGLLHAQTVRMYHSTAEPTKF